MKKLTVLKTDEDWYALEENILNSLDEIQECTFRDLDDGGDGTGFRVINRAKYNVDSIINGLPVRLD